LGEKRNGEEGGKEKFSHEGFLGFQHGVASG
jgi:hypothetical protein